jgi:multiple sugar transport system permease protein
MEIMGKDIPFLPQKLIWSNFSEGWKGVNGITYTTFFSNTFKIVAIVMVGALASNSLVGFGFARLKFKYRDLLFILVLSVMMLPYQVTMIPTYIVWSKLGFVNTYVPLCFGAFFSSAFYVFLFRQFMAGIPMDLDEAAVCDGSSIFGIYWRIALPLSKPVMFTIGLFTFGEVYDDFMSPLIYLNDIKKFTHTVALRLFVSNDGATNWGPILAVTFLSMIPTMLVFFVSQRNLIKGIATTGLKA